MLLEEDRAKLLAALGDQDRTTADVEPLAWGSPDAWDKLKECLTFDYVERPAFKPGMPTKDVTWRLTDAGRAWATAPPPATLPDEFLRCGMWCDCEATNNDRDGIREAGVSVYLCSTPSAECWAPLLDGAWQKNWRTTTGTTTWYLVRGQKLNGVGGDGEPLVRRLDVLHELTWTASRPGTGYGCFTKREKLTDWTAQPHATHPEPQRIGR